MKLKTLLTTALLLSFTVLTACTHTHAGHPRTTGDVVTDTAITTKVKSALLAEKDINSLDISVETFNGTVQLSGFVNSEWQVAQAARVTETVHGVVKVKNNLIHKPQ